MKAIMVRDRNTDRLYEEHVDMKSKMALTLSNYIPKRWVGKLSNIWTDQCSARYTQGDPTDSIKQYIDEFKINTTELKHPDIGYYRTFNDWFQRELKDEYRPLSDNPLSIVSPADCRIRAEISQLDGNTGLVKGVKMNWDKILGEAYQYIYGEKTIYYCRLAYQDYHRFHMPVGGYIVGYQTLGDSLYPVHSLYEGRDWLENLRCVIRVYTPGVGIWAMVVIGASCVGSIVLRDKVKANVWMEKGEEMGMFGLGGSAIIVLFSYDRVKPDQDLINTFVETVVKVREKVGILSIT